MLLTKLAYRIDHSRFRDKNSRDSTTNRGLHPLLSTILTNPRQARVFWPRKRFGETWQPRRYDSAEHFSLEQKCASPNEGSSRLPHQSRAFWIANCSRRAQPSQIERPVCAGTEHDARLQQQTATATLEGSDETTPANPTAPPRERGDGSKRGRRRKEEAEEEPPTAWCYLCTVETEPLLRQRWWSRTSPQPPFPLGGFRFR